MTRISGVSKSGGAAPTKKTKASGGPFETEAGVAASPSGGAGAVASASALSALIALQADPTFRDGRGRGKTLVAAQQILDSLHSLQHSLLDGAPSASTVSALEKAAALRAHAGAEPELLAIYDEIALRARVELAKLGR